MRLIVLQLNCNKLTRPAVGTELRICFLQPSRFEQRVNNRNITTVQQRNTTAGENQVLDSRQSGVAGGWE